MWQNASQLRAPARDSSGKSARPADRASAARSPAPAWSAALAARLAQSGTAPPPTVLTHHVLRLVLSRADRMIGEEYLYGSWTKILRWRPSSTDEFTKRKKRRQGRMPYLNDSVVLLTGGATGIGRAIALDMAAAGAAVAIGDTNIDDGQRTVEEILSAGGKASFRSCDVAEAEQVTALVNGAVADFGQLDILVNDAGISGGSRRLHELDIDAWDRTIAVNLRGTSCRPGRRSRTSCGARGAP